MDVPKTDVGGWGAKASPQRGPARKEVEGLPEAFRRGNRMKLNPISGNLKK
jgi:hypothetical protein